MMMIPKNLRGRETKHTKKMTITFIKYRNISDHKSNKNENCICENNRKKYFIGERAHTLQMRKSLIIASRKEKGKKKKKEQRE